MKNLIALSILLVMALHALTQPFPPVNKNASPEAKQLLSYLYNIKGKYILSGQHNYNESMNRFSDSVKVITGKEPAVWSTDFISDGITDPGQAIVDACKQKHKDGYLITLMWHQGRPGDDPPYGWKESIQGKLTDQQWKDLTTPGTNLYNRWLAQIDVVAGYLKQLNDAHIPVLWRPYHEMNGIWFWWGNKKGKDGLSKLWQIMYDRYVNHFHLDNLIWVWGANGPRDIPGDEAYAYKDFYPGADYVDVLGTDIYHTDYEQKDYTELLDLAKGKPIALTEVGELPNSLVLNAQPEWIWFVVWSDWIYTHNSKQQVMEVYNREQTLTLDEVKLKSK